MSVGETFKLESPYGDELPNKVNIFQVNNTPSVSQDNSEAALLFSMLKPAFLYYNPVLLPHFTFSFNRFNLESLCLQGFDPGEDTYQVSSI